ncbi:MAG TPA: alpha/beta hydrolase, partial [Candidatus Nanopelagicales bacterium]|nr:alpha/beta hydrolase [Candidatus Nanopelagicales bacterium]
MAPTVVLLHAFPFDRHVWDGVVDALADAEWDVVVPDLRGFGESAYGEDGPDDEPSLSWMARDVLSILDRLGVSSAVFAGISMGGYVAMEIVRQDPSRVAGVALVDTKATADSEEARANRLKVADQVLAADSTEALARAMVPTLLGTTSQEERPEVVAQVKAWIEAADPAAVAWAQRAMAARPDSLADLASLAVPGLVVWGVEDGMSPCAEQDLMVDAMRDARLVVITESGHLLTVEAPDQVADALVTFLADV